MTPAGDPGDRGGSVTARVEHFWWHWLPGTAARLSTVLAAMLSEGRYLLALPGAGAVLPAVALLLGLVAGVARFGSDAVFTQSALILAAGLVLGFVATLCGAAFAAGYILTDLVVHRPGGFFRLTLLDQLQLQAGLAITYVALLIMTVGLPVVVRLVRAQLPDLGERFAEARVVADLAVSTLAAGAVTFLYVQALPMFVRPVWTWQGRSPPVDAIAPVQEHAWAFALGIALVAGLRTLVEYGAAVLDPDALEQDLPARAPPGSAGFSPRAAVLRVLAGSLLVTLLLSGLTMTLVENLVLLGGLSVIGLARAFVAAWLPRWPRLTARVPASLRLAAGLILAYWVGGFLLEGRMRGVSFMILIWALLAGFVCLAILFPPEETARGTAAGEPAGEAGATDPTESGGGAGPGTGTEAGQ